MTMPADIAALFVVLALLVIVVAARSDASRGWERAGLACLALAMMAIAVEGRSPKLVTSIPGAGDIGRWLLLIAVVALLVSLARDLRRGRIKSD